MSDISLKILYVTSTLGDDWGGGEPIVTRNTIKLLKSMGYNVIGTFYKQMSKGFISKLISFLRTYMSPSDSFILSFLYYKKVIKREAPDIIISQYDYDGSIIKAAITEKKNIVVYVHVWWPVCPKINLFTDNSTICTGFTNSNCGKCLINSFKPLTFMKKAYKKGFGLLTNTMIHGKMNRRIDLLSSDYVKIAVLSARMKQILTKNGISGEKISVIPNSVSCTEFAPNITNREPIVGYYGGENSLKGFEEFFNIAKIVKLIDPNIRFVATGNFKNKSPYVEFVGVLNGSELKKLLAKSKCTIIPSIWEEPFNLVALETMASGTPPVAFDVGVLRNLIQDGESGFVVPVFNINEMVDRVVKIITNEQLFTKLSAKSREVACQFTEEKRIELLRQLMS